jgi:hypothetical protein
MDLAIHFCGSLSQSRRFGLAGMPTRARLLPGI